MRKLTLFCVLLAAISATTFSQTAWNLEKDENGIKVYTRSIPGSDYKEYKAEATFKTSLNALVAVLDDVDNQIQWLYDCLESKRIKTLNDFEGYNYYIQRLPWPLKNRDIITKYKVAQNPDSKVVTIHTKGYKDFMPLTEYVRVPKIEGYWQFVPLPNKEVKIIYQLHSEPGGSVPSSVANAFIVDMPFKTLGKLKQMVLVEKYRKFNSKLIVEL